MEEFLSHTFFNNTVENYLIALFILVGGITTIRLMRNRLLAILYRLTERTETQLDDYLVRAFERFGLPMLNLLCLYGALIYLHLPKRWDDLIHDGLWVAFVFYLIRMISSMIRKALETFVRRQEQGEEKVKQLRGIMLLVNLVIWLVGSLVVLDGLGYNVRTLVAGLGIGGIAIALAAQNILGDLFNYFVIFFDRPFEVGDFVTVDDKRGTVEHIGIKTTRLKSISGEQLVVSNSDLTKSRIHNFKRMQRRRIVFTLGVTYQTPAEKLEKIPGIIQAIVEDHALATPDRVHFAGFGDFSLNFEVVYFVESAEYIEYMNIQQDINLRIYRAFAAEGIEFAYPTQTIFVAK